MKKTLTRSLVGFWSTHHAGVAAATRKEGTLASINQSGTTLAKRHVYRTISMTEARLRARNNQSWMTSTKGWSDFFGRLMSFARRSLVTAPVPR